MKEKKLPQIGNIPSVIPSAAEKDNCFGSAPLNKKIKSFRLKMLLK